MKLVLIFGVRRICRPRVEKNMPKVTYLASYLILLKVPSFFQHLQFLVYLL